jgi:cysteinyl-tRNA synthetase
MAAAPAFEGEFALALNDDLNTPKAIAALHALDGEALAAALVALGFAGDLDRENGALIDAGKVEALIAARAAARTAKDFAAADRLRGEIEALGVILKDAKDKTTGAFVTTWEPRR